MPREGVRPKRLEEIFVCTRCGAQEPSDHYFNKLDEQDRETWINRPWSKQ
jgi:transcription elongation factor Elf1